MLTIPLLQKAMPSTLRSYATQALCDQLNNISNDQFEADLMRETFIGYTSVMAEGKYKTEDYINAVKYVSFKLMKHTNEEAYVKTFPQRYQTMMANGMVKNIGQVVHAYSRNKLVNKIMEQTVTPTWVLNQDIYQEAINVQASIMRDVDVSPKVRSDAADSLMTQLARPKEVGPLVNIDMRDTSGIKEMRDSLAKMAEQQLALMDNGLTAKQVAEQDITDVEDKNEDASPTA